MSIILMSLEASYLAERSANEERFDTVEISRSALRIGDPFEYTRFIESGANIGVVPFPVSDENRNSTPLNPLFVDASFSISAGSTNPDAAWAWVRFLLQQDITDNPFPSPYANLSIPSRRSVAEASGVFDELDEEYAAALRYGLDHAFVSYYPQVDSDDFYEGWNRFGEQNPNVVEILTEIQTSYDKAVAQVAEATPIPQFEVAAPPSSEISPDDVVVRFVVMDANNTLYRSLADQFNEANPGIVIKIEEPNFFGGDFSLEGMVSSADCFKWWNPISAEADLEMVLSLQPFLDADSELSERDFYPAAFEKFRQDSQIMGLPASIEIPLLAYNKNIFDAAGVPYPEPNWTLDDFLNTATALTTDAPDGEKVYGFVPDLFEVSTFFQFLSTMGADMMDRSVDPPQAVLTSPEFISAVRWYTNLSTEYGVKPSFNIDFSGAITEDIWQQKDDLVQGDRAGLWPYDTFVSFGGSLELAEQADQSHVGLVPYPQGETSAGLSNVSGYYIRSNTNVRQPCWEWIKYMTGEASTAPSGLPARISTAESDVFAQKVGADAAQTMIDTVQNMSAETGNQDDSFDSWFGGNFEIFQDAALDIFDGTVPVEEGLQKAQDRTERYRLCIIEQDLVDSGSFEEWEACLSQSKDN